MRRQRVIVLAWLAFALPAGCRGIVGYEDTQLGADGAGGQAGASGSGGTPSSGGSSGSSGDADVGVDGSSGSSGNAGAGDASAGSGGGSEAGTAPQVDSIAPARYWNDEPVLVTIKGSGFGAGATARVGSQDLTDVTVVDATTLTAILPAGLAGGKHAVTVSNVASTPGMCADCFEATLPVHLTGTLSGAYVYSDLKVIVDGTVRVAPWNGSDDVASCDAGETGCLDVRAAKIVVAGGAMIDASGSGYFGRRGGGGGGGGGPVNVSGGAGGPGSQPGQTGSSGNCNYGGGAGGDAGTSAGGGGSFVGSSGPAGSADGGPGGTGGRGGYAKSYTSGDTSNGDTTTDETLLLGSGGGGGGGGGGGASGNNCCDQEGGAGGGGGGAGNRGGGYVRLFGSAAVEILGDISTQGLIDAAGNGQNGASVTVGAGRNGGKGGSASGSGTSSGGPGGGTVSSGTCGSPFGGAGGPGGKGGAGAGGGVLVKAPVVVLSGSVDARGGGSTQAASATGGTLKVFHQGAEPSVVTAQAGRVYLATY